ncbi:MAG: endonuclease III [Thermostichus sp. BF3_bins_97]
MSPQLGPTDFAALEQVEDREERERLYTQNAIYRHSLPQGTRYTKGTSRTAERRSWQSLDAILRSDRNASAALPYKNLRRARIFTALTITSVLVAVAGTAASAREGLDFSEMNGTGAILLGGGLASVGIAIAAGVFYGKTKKGYEIPFTRHFYKYTPLRPREEIEALIHSTGFYRNKAKHIQGACEKILTDFGGELPRTMPELLTLPGVARKTANVVLAHAFGINAGVTVDTHVKRLSRRLGLTDQADPVRIEKALMQLLPQPDWENWSIRLIDHGRAICDARKPLCEQCFLADLCPTAPLIQPASTQGKTKQKIPS